MRYVLVVLVLAALVGGFLALGWKDAIFGDRESRESEAPPPAPAVAEAEGGSAADGSSSSARPLLFGRKPQDLRGVGAVTLRVVRYGANAPVAGAKVSLQGTGHGGEAVALETTTDANGGAALDAVPAGDGLTLRVDAPREPPQERGDVRVVAGRTTELGTVFVGARAALVGRVVDERGAPVAGAAVGVHRAEGSWLDLMSNFDELLATLDREPKPLASTESGADGTFRVEAVPAGEWTVVARAPGRLDARESATLGAKGLLSKPLVLVLGPGAVVAGTVVTEGGAGVPGARLAFFAEGSADPREFLHGRIFATTNVDGSFRAAVRPELRTVRAVVAAEGRPTHVSERVPVGATDVRIVLHAAVPVEVRVVTKEGGRAVEGARTTIAVQMSDEDGSAATLFATTGPDGRATLECPPGKVVMLMVSHPTLPGGFTNSQFRDNPSSPQAMGAVIDADFPDEIAAGRANRIEVRLQAGVAVVGKVTDPAGAPIAGAEVSVATFFPMGGARGRARSGADGSYRLEGARSGTPLALVVKAPGWTLGPGDGLVKGSPDASGEIAKDLVLHPSTTVRGRVVDGDGGGVPGAKVTVSLAGQGAFDLSSLGAPTATTGDDGSYAIFDVGEGGGLAAMMAAFAGEAEAAKPREAPKARVRAARDGFVDGESAEFTLAEGGHVEAPAITLARGATVRGNVLDPSGNPLPHARLQARIERKGEGPRFSMPGLDRDSRAIAADGDGAFELAGLPEGTLTLTARRTGLAGAQRTVPVPATGEVAADLRLRPAREVRGRAVGTDGRAVPRAVVVVEGLVGASGDDAYVESVSERAKGDGSFVLRGLPPGRVRLRARAQGYVDATAEAETGGHSVEVVLPIRSASDLDRLKEIDVEAKRLLAEIVAAKSDDQRTALQQRWAELQQEKSRLEAKGRATGE